jgi:uncharacterized RDD family membrane protein YckC
MSSACQILSLYPYYLKSLLLMKGDFMLQQPYPYGSGFKRFLAFVIDSLLLGIVGAVVDLSFGASTRLVVESLGQQTVFPSLIKLFVHLLYWPLCESSTWQATPGKRLCRLYVTDLSANRLSFARAFIRNIAKLISLLPLGFGFLMIALTVRNQCLHDKIVGTLVFSRNNKVS